MPRVRRAVISAGQRRARLHSTRGGRSTRSAVTRQVKSSLGSPRRSGGHESTDVASPLWAGYKPFRTSRGIAGDHDVKAFSKRAGVWPTNARAKGRPTRVGGRALPGQRPGLMRGADAVFSTDHTGSGLQAAEFRRAGRTVVVSISARFGGELSGAPGSSTSVRRRGGPRAVRPTSSNKSGVRHRNTMVFDQPFSDVSIDAVRTFWNTRPCNIRHSPKQVGTREYFDEVEHRKYFVESHIPAFADFARWRGKRVLEIGCGLGTDTVNFARAGAQVTAIDLSDQSAALARQRLDVYGLGDRATIHVGNAEELPGILPPQHFDLVYSFGVIHHSPHPRRIVEHLRQYMTPQSELRLMVVQPESATRAVPDHAEGRRWT